MYHLIAIGRVRYCNTCSIFFPRTLFEAGGHYDHDYETNKNKMCNIIE